MDTPTHALIPVIVYGVMRQKELCYGTRGEKIAVWRTAVLTGFVGAMPDMMDPHVTLEERLNSWSHSLVAWFGFSVLFGVISLALKRWVSPVLAAGLSATYFSHIVGDAIAGGVGWSYPFGHHVIGDYYIIPEWWIPADFVCFAVAYVVYRVVPMFASRRRQHQEVKKRREATLAEVGVTAEVEGE
ncbi:MAG: hypothetical protein ACI8XO_000903 [Verrucomicrobiales bacterium]|jgi:hypothetical protein